MELFRIHKTIPFMKYSKILNAISFISFFDVFTSKDTPKIIFPLLSINELLFLIPLIKSDNS